MRKIIVLLVCLLLIASALPLFAHGQRGHHGRHWSASTHRWQGSNQHPCFHGWRGWGQAPGNEPGKDDPSKPPGDPEQDPGDKPGTDPVGTPGDKGGRATLEQLLKLDPRTGSFPG